MVTMPWRRASASRRETRDTDDADQRGDVGLTLLLQVVQLGHPAQQLVVFVALGSIRASAGHALGSGDRLTISHA